VEKFGITPILKVDKGEGSSGDSIVILSEKQLPVNCRYFLPPIHTINIVIPVDVT
jgi:hypothetical protein